MRRRRPNASVPASCTVAGWLMVWIAAVIVVVGLLVPEGVKLGAASSVALLAGVPIILAFLAVPVSPGQAVAIALLLAALYGWLARGIWQGSTMALELSLVLLLGDLGGGVLAALGTGGETPAGLVILVAAVFFGPRLGLIYLISHCLSQKRDDPIALKIGALVQGLVWFLIDPIGWLFYLADRSTPAAHGRAAQQKRVHPSSTQTSGKTDEESGFD